MSSSELVNHAARGIEAAGEDGQRSFTALRLVQACAEAAAIDRAAGDALPPFAGIPIAVKEICSTSPARSPARGRCCCGGATGPAGCRRHRAAEASGFIVIGRTNMT
ncbi:hypothetical protein J5Y06_15020 [Tianweitania sediminis]|uniref:Amidase domain-containing protein n=1 Tax=Tianweitania sediminis TaxID=1502156 RepID=A0A8J7UI75_9HYPH|nr:hypothetical protein [Tianweitania sediminis]